MSPFMTHHRQKAFLACGLILCVCPMAAWAVTSEHANLASELGRILGMALFGYWMLRLFNRKKSDPTRPSLSGRVWRMVCTVATRKTPTTPSADQVKTSLLSRILRVLLWGLLVLMLFFLANALYQRYLLSVA